MGYLACGQWSADPRVPFGRATMASAACYSVISVIRYTIPNIVGLLKIQVTLAIRFVCFKYTFPPSTGRHAQCTVFCSIMFSVLNIIVILQKETRVNVCGVRGGSIQSVCGRLGIVHKFDYHLYLQYLDSDYAIFRWYCKNYSLV